MHHSPEWQAGYTCATREPLALITAIEPPADYTDDQREDYVSGFFVGAREANVRDREAA
jgi:hypothetical protein